MRPLGVLWCVQGVLGHLAPVHRCVRLVCCFVCAVSWATWLLFTGVPARCAELRLRCPGPLGSCSPVRPFGALLCLCGVVGPLAPVHRCACVVCPVACAVSWATLLLFTGAPSRCVVLCVGCPGSLGSCSRVCPPGVLLCVCGVLGHLAPADRCAWPLCPIPLLSLVLVRARCPGPGGAWSPACALCAVCLCRWWLCLSSSPPNSFFLFSCLLVSFFFFGIECKLLWSIVDSCLYLTHCDCSPSCFDPVYPLLAYLWLGVSWGGCLSTNKAFSSSKTSSRNPTPTASSRRGTSKMKC